MKPITFENLRRLIGGRRKNKDRNESPFKRSESFKRISIRRNYLESRGGGQKGRNPTKKPPAPIGDDPQQRPSCEIIISSGKTTTSCRSDSPNVASVAAAAAAATAAAASPSVTSPSPPAAGPPPVCPLPALPCKEDDDADAEHKRRTAVAPVPPRTPPSTAAAAPVIDYGEWIRCIRIEEDLNNLKRSCSPPTPPARYRYHHKELDDSSRTDSAISLGGRIWMDAPMLPPAAPRSLELPGRPVATADADGLQQRRAHHSLESALKDKRADDRPVPCRRFHRYPVVDKTASRSSVASTCSGKDSGFSLSAPGLSDPPRPAKQLFRKKAPRRPAAAQQQPSITSKPSSTTITPCSASTQLQDRLYNVVAARSPLRQLKLDPTMFVPPEKRRPGKGSAQHHQRPTNKPLNPKPRPVVEIRDYCVPKDARLQLQRRDDDDDDEEDDDDFADVYDERQDRLYESISKGRGRWQESTDDADTEDDLHQQHRSCAATATAAARNRVKRKKSARRDIKYVVKPVRRAPSVATRKPSVTAKCKSSWITTSKSRERFLY